MMKISTVKSTAFSILKKCWAESAFISLLSAGIFMGVYVLLILVGRLAGVHTEDTIMPVYSSFSVPYMLFAIALLVVTYAFYAPLHFGIRWYFWQASSGEQLMPLSSLFACYSSRESVSRCIKLKFFTDIRRLGFAVIFGGLAALEIILGIRLWNSIEHSNAAGVIIILVCTATTLCLVMLYVVFTMKYVPVSYLWADDPYSGTKRIFDLSRQVVAKRYYRMIMLYLSCTNIALLCVLIFPVLFLQPVFCLYTAVFIRDGLREDSETNDDNVSEEQIKAEVTV